MHALGLVSYNAHNPPTAFGDNSLAYDLNGKLPTVTDVTRVDTCSGTVKEINYPPSC